MTQLIGAFTSWQVINEARPDWLGPPYQGLSGSNRTRAMFLEVLERMLLP